MVGQGSQFEMWSQEQLGEAAGPVDKRRQAATGNGELRACDRSSGSTRLALAPAGSAGRSGRRTAHQGRRNLRGRTFGRGGHSRAILARLGSRGKADRARSRSARRRVPQRRSPIRVLRAFHAQFGRLREVVRRGGSGAGRRRAARSGRVLAAARGGGPRIQLPLRRAARHAHGHEPRDRQPRNGWRTASEQEIGEVIKTYGEERFASQIARAIVAARSGDCRHHPATCPDRGKGRSGRASQVRTRRRGHSRLYGFSSIKSLKSCR